MSKKNPDISLVKTDYDNFKDLSFFMEQQRKAEAMLREVEEFKKSFVMSKMVSLNAWVRENPLYGLQFFVDAFLTIDFTPNGIRGYIKADTGDFHWFAPKKEERWYGYYSIDECYMKKYPKIKRQVLNKFFDDTHRSFQHGQETMLLECSEDLKLTPWNYADEEETLYIIKDWQKYVDSDFLKTLDEEYETYRQKMHRAEEQGIGIETYKTPPNVLKKSQVFKLMEQRFALPISYIRELYVKYPSLTIEKMGTGCTCNSKWTHHFHFDDEKNNCVIWKGRPRWVSNNLDNVKITTSADRSEIICTFKDTATYKEQNYFSYYTKEERTCELTYSAKNNELKDYQVYSHKTKLCDERRY